MKSTIIAATLFLLTIPVLGKELVTDTKKINAFLETYGIGDEFDRLLDFYLDEVVEAKEQFENFNHPSSEVIDHFEHKYSEVYLEFQQRKLKVMSALLRNVGSKGKFFISNPEYLLEEAESYLAFEKSYNFVLRMISVERKIKIEKISDIGPSLSKQVLREDEPATKDLD